MLFGITRRFSGLESGSSTSALANTFVRYFSRKRVENLRKVNPKVTPQEASSIAHHLYDLIKLNGPLTVSNAWIQAKENGISGLNSKTHMKLLLKWMRGRKMLKLFCNQVGSNKKFFLSTLPEDPLTADQFKETMESRMQMEKSSAKGRKQSKIRRRV